MVSGVITTITKTSLSLQSAAQAILEKPTAEILGKPRQAIAHLTPALSPITQKIFAETAHWLG
jgi:hypothetical protein